MKIKNMKSIRKPAFFAMTALLVTSLFTGCGKKAEPAAASGIKVNAEPVEYGTLKISTDYIATLSPNLTVDVMPLVAGTVKSLPVKVGDQVKAGDLLCQLDDTSAEFSVKSAEDAVNSARAGKDAAELQTDSARIQADGNIRTLRKTIDSLNSSLKTAKKQLKRLQSSKKNIQKSQAAARKSYTDAKKRYKLAQALQVQFEVFLNDNPDCRTTAGLTAAATAQSGNSLQTGTVTGQTPSSITGNKGSSSEMTQTPSANQSGNGSTDQGKGQTPAQDSTGNGQAGSGQTGNSATGQNGNSDPSAPSAGQAEDSAAYAAAAAKKKQAQALLKALTEAGLTVEYISQTGVNALKETSSDAESAYNAASSGISQVDSGIATLKTNISQLKSQISSSKDSLATARKLADAASAGSEVYDAQIEAAETGVEAARYQKDMYRLTSPIDGVVDAVNVKKEGMAAQGFAAFTISEKDSMLASFYVTDDVRNFLQVGDTVSLLKNDAEETEALGHITSIGTAADPQKGLFKIEAEFITAGQKALSSGLSVKLSVISNAVEGQLLIPYDAVYYDDGQAYVYKLEDGKAHRADVETGLFNQKDIAILSGLAEGDSIISSWASGLKDGASVEVMSGEDE